MEEESDFINIWKKYWPLQTVPPVGSKAKFQASISDVGIRLLRKSENVSGWSSIGMVIGFEPLHEMRLSDGPAVEGEVGERMSLLHKEGVEDSWKVLFGSGDTGYYGIVDLSHTHFQYQDLNSETMDLLKITPAMLDPSSVPPRPAPSAQIVAESKMRKSKISQKIRQDQKASAIEIDRMSDHDGTGDKGWEPAASAASSSAAPAEGIKDSFTGTSAKKRGRPKKGVAIDVEEEISVGDIQLACSVCGKKFKSAGGLKYHSQNVCISIKDFLAGLNETEDTIIDYLPKQVNTGVQDSEGISQQDLLGDDEEELCRDRVGNKPGRREALRIDSSSDDSSLDDNNTPLEISRGSGGGRSGRGRARLESGRGAIRKLKRQKLAALIDSGAALEGTVMNALSSRSKVHNITPSSSSSSSLNSVDDTCAQYFSFISLCKQRWRAESIAAFVSTLQASSQSSPIPVLCSFSTQLPVESISTVSEWMVEMRKLGCNSFERAISVKFSTAWGDATTGSKGSDLASRQLLLKPLDCAPIRAQLVDGAAPSADLDVVINCGGSVWDVSFSPPLEASGSISPQKADRLLAIALSKPTWGKAATNCSVHRDSDYLLGGVYNHPNLLQFWRVHGDGNDVSLDFAVSMNRGPCWKVHWYPSVVKSLVHSGSSSTGTSESALIAIVCGDGSCAILDIPCSNREQSTRLPSSSSTTGVMDRSVVPESSLLRWEVTAATAGSPISCAAWSPHGSPAFALMLCCGLVDGSLTIWGLSLIDFGVELIARFAETSLGRQQQPSWTAITAIRPCPYHPSLLASCGYDGALRVWNISDPTAPVYEKRPQLGWCMDMQWDPHGMGLLSCGSDTTSVHWDSMWAFEQAKKRAFLYEHKSKFSGLWKLRCISLDGHTLVLSASADGTVRCAFVAVAGAVCKLLRLEHALPLQLFAVESVVNANSQEVIDITQNDCAKDKETESFQLSPSLWDGPVSNVHVSIPPTLSADTSPLEKCAAMEAQLQFAKDNSSLVIAPNAAEQSIQALDTCMTSSARSSRMGPGAEEMLWACGSGSGLVRVQRIRIWNALCGIPTSQV